MWGRGKGEGRRGKCGGGGEWEGARIVNFGLKIIITGFWLEFF